MKRQHCIGKTVCLVITGIFILGGCGREKQEIPENSDKEYSVETEETRQAEETVQAEKTEQDAILQDDTISEPETVEADWARYFEGLNGAAVLYDPSAMRYTVYNRELSQTRRSPCSTFKIISSLAALESGTIDPDDSLRIWSGETFWNEDWNHDMEFQEAFRVSCVWYFREIINEIGQGTMQRELDRLQYGNCDSSDWEGRQNTNNSNRALTGFWIESSLMISPQEQTEVMERIFGDNSVYSQRTLDALRQAMLTEQEEKEISVYGKTGMGKAEGVVVDAWFTGFAERAEGPLYFCVYLGRTDGKTVSSAAAKEIVVRLVADACRGSLPEADQN